MKTTNYEISRQLAEAKFKANQVWNQEGKFWGYDLETILEALPNRITNENIFIPRIDYYLRLSKEQIWYENQCNCDSNENCPVDQRFEVSRIKDESLVDTAARLWLKLKQESLV